MFFFQGNGLWKYFPSKLYRDYAKNEDRLYEILVNIIKKTLQEDELTAETSENSSILKIILKTEGLDIRDKVGAIIGELSI
jgi:hypothetical protein